MLNVNFPRVKTRTQGHKRTKKPNSATAHINSSTPKMMEFIIYNVIRTTWYANSR